MPLFLLLISYVSSYFNQIVLKYLVVLLNKKSGRPAVNGSARRTVTEVNDRPYQAAIRTDARSNGRKARETAAFEPWPEGRRPTPRSPGARPAQAAGKPRRAQLPGRAGTMAAGPRAALPARSRSANIDDLWYKASNREER